jgi:spore coat protein CotH
LPPPLPAATAAEGVPPPGGIPPVIPKPPKSRRLRRTLLVLVVTLACIGWSVVRIIDAVHDRIVRFVGPRSGGWRPPDQPVSRPTKALAALATPIATTNSVQSAADLYGITNLWTFRLEFTPDQWAGLEPNRIEQMQSRRRLEIGIELRNPAAKRSGLAGVRGLEFDWVHATVRFEDREFTNAAVRYKGNGTFLNSQRGSKKPFKVDLNKFNKGQRLAGRATFNLHNMVVDDSFMSDALGYEVFRAAGVPAPRTAYARVFTSVGDEQPRYLGLYVLVENLDQDFARDQLGTKDGIIFKPVTYELFHDLGEDWAAYRPIYDPKTQPTPDQQRRVIEFAKLLSNADDETYARRVGEFLDLDQFARFVAVNVLLSSYDGFLYNGQNFYLWLDPRSNRFVFLPWDLDQAWGEFQPISSLEDRAHASIMHPWVGEHRLLERTMAVEEFSKLYRARLRELVETEFAPAKLHRRVDELAAWLRPVVAEESPWKRNRFEGAITGEPVAGGDNNGLGWDHGRPPHPLKWFIAERAESVRDQLDGRSEGVIVRRHRW